MKEFFDYTIFKIGKHELKLVSVLLVVLLIVAVKVILWLIKKSINSASHIEASKKYAVFNLIKYVFIVISIIVGFQVLGFNFTLLLGGAAAKHFQ